MDEIHIRIAHEGDVPHLVRHRRAMFEEMGTTDDGVLDRMSAASERYFRRAVSDGTFRGWLAETLDREVVAGGGVAIVHWPGSPDFPETRRGWILNVYTDPEYRNRGVARKVMDE